METKDIKVVVTIEGVEANKQEDALEELRGKMGGKIVLAIIGAAALHILGEQHTPLYLKEDASAIIELTRNLKEDAFFAIIELTRNALWEFISVGGMLFAAKAGYDLAKADILRKKW